jgi:glycosyltransferase involved in cell wall biosynthesis
MKKQSTPAVTICFTYFRSLAMANLRAALYSVRRQDLSAVEEIVVVDNNTDDAPSAIHDAIDEQAFPVPVKLLSFKHGDASRTHSWSSNVAVRASSTPWVLFTRADYLLDFDALATFMTAPAAHKPNWDGFVTGHVYHLSADIGMCESTSWRTNGTAVLRALPGAEETYTEVDSGVWLARRSAFDAVGGLDERLTAWGHAQTHFQWKLHKGGTEFVRVPKPLFYHPMHGAPRDIERAHEQLLQHGIDLHELWDRHQGVKPYSR